jgi:hypothetical protein
LFFDPSIVNEIPPKPESIDFDQLPSIEDLYEAIKGMASIIGSPWQIWPLSSDGNEESAYRDVPNFTGHHTSILEQTRSKPGMEPNPSLK